MESRRIGKGILAMLLAMIMVMNGVRGGDFGNYGTGYNFNGKHHDVLCEALKASADLWNASRTSDLRLERGLEKALGEALFGNHGKKDLAAITEVLPSGYNSPKHRGMWCGRCRQKEEKHYYPGSSITHDLMCLCTSGKFGEPFYSWWWNFFLFRYGFSTTSYKLCGKKREELVKDQSDGWFDDGEKKGSKGLDKSWKTVVWGCFDSRNKNDGIGSLDLREKVARLIETMKNFTNTLKHSKGRHKLGGFDGHDTESDGSDEKSMHVWYHDCERVRKPWWKKLNASLTSKPEGQLLVSRSAPSPAAGAGAEPQDDQEQREEDDIVTQGDPHQVGETSADGIDGNQTPGTTNNANSTVGMLNTSASGNSSHPRFEYLRSGSHISQSLLFLSAMFLI
ncbi:Variant surface glycoprotein [Trypanosoma congolense IL3000]|uniref:Variant surface glycoprotein n=1 Tax=Trypanosoma congolense (strain IL3000) TaxID=1068625 RepID=F9WFH0_TRYCI|nr:Variant surface glycoprotein [Trypanosoma congolense IL3000]